eukprot:gene13950-biopygen20078
MGWASAVYSGIRRPANGNGWADGWRGARGGGGGAGVGSFPATARGFKRNACFFKLIAKSRTKSAFIEVSQFSHFVTGGSKRPGNSGLRAAIRTAARARKVVSDDTDGIWDGPASQAGQAKGQGAALPMDTLPQRRKNSRQVFSPSGRNGSGRGPDAILQKKRTRTRRGRDHFSHWGARRTRRAACRLGARTRARARSL